MSIWHTLAFLLFLSSPFVLLGIVIFISVRAAIRSSAAKSAPPASGHPDSSS